MAKTKIDVRDLKKMLDSASDAVTKDAADAVGDLTVALMKDRISKGLSPIEGRGRFERYKNPKSYPDKVREEFPDKRRRPVNLKLSGKFLDALKSKSSPSGNKITIGFFDSYGRKLEQGHRDGANGQPERPVIPEGGELLAKSIRLSIIRLFEQSVRKYLKQRR